MITRSLFPGRRIRVAALVACALVLLTGAATAATITIANMDGAGEGFNDPTPAAPVGGNPGTTKGAQRLYVFQHAANIWGSLLPSNVTVVVSAKFDPLSCTATSGVLGSAGPVTVSRDFAGAPFANTYYHAALANKLAGSDLVPGTADINATFNSDLGSPTCLPVGWYFGVDGNEGGQIELLPVVLHELGHGLGFSTTTNGQTGVQLSGRPSVYDRFIFDNTSALHWSQMSDAQRAASGINCQRLVWDGPVVAARAPLFLGPKPLLHVSSPAGVVADYDVGLASFGPALGSGGLSGQVVLVNDGVGNVTNGCEALINGGAVAGKVAFIDRGTCGFTVKVKDAQNAGAIAAIIADSLPGCPPAGMGGADPTITIPSVRITQADGALLRANIAAGLNVTLIVDPTKLAGADALGHVEVYTPNPYQGGSSVSHWDVSAEPSLLMEPAITNGLSSNVDLTAAMYADIGWFIGSVGVGPTSAPTPQLGISFPNPAASTASIGFSLVRDEVVDLSIYDLNGRLVNRLLSGMTSAGGHTVQWDASDAAGRRVAPGVYLYRLRTPSFNESRHLAVVR